MHKDRTRMEILAKWEKGKAAAAKKKAWQEAEAAKKRARQETMELKKAQAAAALAKKDAENAAKEKAKQEAMELKKAQAAAALAKKDAENAAKEKAKQETLIAKKAQEAENLVNKEAEAAAREKIRQETEAAREKAKQETLIAKKAQEAVNLAKKDAEAAAREKIRQEAEAAREKAKQETLIAKKAQATAAMAKKEAETATKEEARQGVEEAKKAQIATAGVKIERKPLAMIPLFSQRSLLILIIGCIMGAVLGLGYWATIPFLKFQTGLPPIRISSSDTAYASTAIIGIVSEGVSYTDPQNLRRQGDFYVSKMSAPSFFDFISKKLAEQAPEYSRSSRELTQMITIIMKYDYLNYLPAIRVEATSTDEREAYLLTSMIIESLPEYLVMEELTAQAEERRVLTEELESVKAALIEAGQDLSKLGPQQAAEDINSDPTYIALNAKINALQNELTRQAIEVATNTAQGDINKDDSQAKKQEYERTLLEINNVNDSLIKAEPELQSLDMQKAITDNIAYNASYIALNAKIEALQAELTKQMTGYTVTDGYRQTTVPGLAELISSGYTGIEYENSLRRVEAVSNALSEAQKQLATLESESKNNDLAKNLDYQLAQANVDALNTKLSTLKDKLTLLASEDANGGNQMNTQASFVRISDALAEAKKKLSILKASTEAKSFEQQLAYNSAAARNNTLRTRLDALTQKLAAPSDTSANSLGAISMNNLVEPSVPTAVPPERPRGRNVLMMGAIAGMCVAWASLNFRWLSKGMPPSSTVPSKPKEYEEDD